MEEPHQDALSLGRAHGGNEIAVSCNQNGFLNLPLGCKLHKVHTQQDIDSLLFKDGAATRVVSSKGQSSEPHVVARKAIKCPEKPPFR